MHELTERNQEYVPPSDKGALYIRAKLFGSGPVLGMANPSPEFTFLAYAVPVPLSYYGKELTPTNLVVETHFQRSAARGMGGTKYIGNYSPVLKHQMASRKQGYHDILFLDATYGKYVEEVAASNFFIVKDKVLYTPELTGSILPGITRSSILTLAPKLGYKAVERKVTIEETLEADEAFASGTAV